MNLYAKARRENLVRGILKTYGPSVTAGAECC